MLFVFLDFFGTMHKLFTVYIINKGRTGKLKIRKLKIGKSTTSYINFNINYLLNMYH